MTTDERKVETIMACNHGHDPRVCRMCAADAEEALEHQRKVAELEEEIKLVEYCRDTYYWCCEEPDTIARILARLQAALSELQRGVKEKA